MPTTPRISATAAIQLAPRSTGERWACGEQMLSRDGGLNRAASTDWDRVLAHVELILTTAGHHTDYTPYLSNGCDSANPAQLQSEVGHAGSRCCHGMVA
jgi:hypothetical protein